MAAEVCQLENVDAEEIVAITDAAVVAEFVPVCAAGSIID